MKKRILALTMTAVMAMACAACTASGQTDSGAAGMGNPNPSQADTNKTEEGTTDLGNITVISREDGSGTRGAFIELFGVEEKNDAGEKVDNTTVTAEITNNTAVMMTSVAENKNAIGYISLGSLNDTVKALKIDGASPSVETVMDGSYPVSRPFNIVTTGKISDVAQDFIDFIMSADGQSVITEEGYVSVQEGEAFESNGAEGKIVVAGSSSVSPVMEVLKEAYLTVNTKAEIEIQTSDSTTGITAAIDGICDIGMASRELKDSESAVDAQEIAKDGIAVIVNNGNTLDELTTETVKEIYTGGITAWGDLS